MDDPNIFEFDDFRLYLRAWFHSRRGRPSQARFATRVPCAKSLVTDILNGNKSLTRMLTPSFARELKLGRRETRYFETMVL